MTRVFDDAGQSVPVTVIKAGPCVVLQVRDEERDGYRAAQLGFLEEGLKPERLTKPMAGHLAKAGSPPVRVIREFALAADDEVNPGDRVTVEQFADVAKVDVTGTTKGRGFQGVVKRYDFAGGKATHGSMFHRAPGAIGQAAWPSRVFKGTRMPGQMGNVRRTTEGLEVVKVDVDNHLLVVKGSVPGARNGYVFIRQAVRG
jgi:large subunit ribosomal protein L3